MRTGLIIGKFLPLHLGHEALIEFGKNNCDRLIVVVCGTPEEEISLVERIWRIQEKYKNVNNIYISCINTNKENLPDSIESSREVSKVWAECLNNKKFFGRSGMVNVVFGSEQYISYLAEYMGIDHLIFNEARTIVPISATKIRQNPWLNWHYISKELKDLFIDQVCIYGPESTGKTTLTKELADYYKTAYVPEMARYMIDWGNKSMDDLTIKHLEEFDNIQRATVKSMRAFCRKFLFCDTDSITTEIYADVLLNKKSRLIENQSTNHSLYLLLDIDVNYQPDHQRNLEDKREEMFQRFENELKKRNINYVIVRGQGKDRLRNAVNAINHHFGIKEGYIG